MESPTACPDWMPFYSTVNVQSFVDICQRKPDQKKRSSIRALGITVPLCMEPVFLGSYRKDILSLHFEHS